MGDRGKSHDRVEERNRLLWIRGSSIFMGGCDAMATKNCKWLYLYSLQSVHLCFDGIAVLQWLRKKANGVTDRPKGKDRSHFKAVFKVSLKRRNMTTQTKKTENRS